MGLEIFKTDLISLSDLQSAGLKNGLQLASYPVRGPDEVEAVALQNERHESLLHLSYRVKRQLKTSSSTSCSPHPSQTHGSSIPT